MMNTFPATSFEVSSRGSVVSITSSRNGATSTWKVENQGPLDKCDCVRAVVFALDGTFNPHAALLSEPCTRISVSEFAIIIDYVEAGNEQMLLEYMKVKAGAYLVVSPSSFSYAFMPEAQAAQIAEIVRKVIADCEGKTGDFDLSFEIFPFP
jgi:hypothetical protein